MSSLTDIEKRYLERLLITRRGYILDYTDATFAEFFKRHNIDIHSHKYQTYGTSKAKKLRAFWDQEPDAVVGPVLSEMLAAYTAFCELSGRKPEQSILEECQAIVARLSKGSAPGAPVEVDDAFLSQEFVIPNLHKLPVQEQVAKIIEARLEEARKAFKAEAYLCVILLSGSVLEAVLLGAAQRYPEKFNRSPISPKTSDGKVKPFHEWSLAQLIDVAHSVGMLRLDVKKLSHALRDFRNFIHPYEQMASQFTPDQHTAKVCFQVLKAALADLAGER